MVDVLVIGDDLTGANATGVLYAKTGRRVVTVSSTDLADMIHDEVDVLVFNAESRHLSGDAAARRVGEIVTRAASWPAQLVKRVDTTLRGNVGAEIEAGLLALRRARPATRQVALMVPAFPASGRTTIGGTQLVDGEPIHRTWAAKDPFTPVRHSNVAAVIAEQSSLKVSSLTLDDLDDQFDTRLAEAVKTADVVVIDARDDDDIRRIASAAATLQDVGLLVVDSGPFGAALAQARTPCVATDMTQPFVFAVVGSLTDQTTRQIDRLVETMGATIITVDLATSTVSEVVAAIAAAVDAGDRIVGVRAAPCQGVPPAEDAQSMLRLLGEITLAAVTRFHPGGVYATGGDVAMTVLSVLDADGFRIIDEALPLAVAGFIVGGPHAGIGLVTKGGLIGDDDAAVTCVKMIQQVSRQSAGQALMGVVEQKES